MRSGSAIPENPTRVLTLYVHGQTPPPLRAVPARVLLKVRPGHVEEAEARFYVLTDADAPDLRVTTSDAESLLSVEPLEGERAPRPHGFAVRWRSGNPVRPGTYSLVVRAPRIAEELVVPVMVLEDGEP